MYVNKCIKCGAEFETKNPKRVICPNCLYADKGTENSEEKPMQSYSSYSSYSQEPRQNRSYDRGQQHGYYNSSHNGVNEGYQRREHNNYNREGYQQRRPQQGGYNRDGYQQRRPSQGGYNRDGQQQRRPSQGGFRNNYASGGGRPQQRKPQQRRPQKQARPLLVSKEQLEQIELLYKAMLPLPNPDAHEVIGAKMELEPQKVFFGINLVRQKMMLPKLPFPKRKLAISADQMMAIKALYEPLLPLPPIGCHKIIAAQLKIDEWRVHVGIKLIRAQMGLDRWNEERQDKPADYMISKHESKTNTEKELVAVEAKTEVKQTEEVVEEVKPKRGRPKKKVDEE